MRQVKQGTKSYSSNLVNQLPSKVPPHKNSRPMVDEEGFTSTSKVKIQATLRGPLELHTLQNAEKLATEQDVPMLCQSPRNSPQKPTSPSPHPPAHTAPAGNHFNHLSEFQIPQATQEPRDIANTGMTTSHEQPSSKSPSRGCTNLVGSYDTSGGTPQL